MDNTEIAEIADSLGTPLKKVNMITLDDYVSFDPYTNWADTMASA